MISICGILNDQKSLAEALRLHDKRREAEEAQKNEDGATFWADSVSAYWNEEDEAKSNKVEGKFQKGKRETG